MFSLITGLSGFKKCKTKWDWQTIIIPRIPWKPIFSMSSYYGDSQFDFRVLQKIIQKWFQVLQKVILYSPPFAFLSTIRLVNHSMVSSLVPFASSITTRGLKLDSTVSKKDQLSTTSFVFSAISWELAK